ncbi:MAG: HAD family hydrolase [Phycisphaerae bacterium]
MLQAIIFDFDGVIVETEPLHCRAFLEVLPAFELPLTRETYFDRLVGLADHEILRRLLAESRRSLSSQDTERLLRMKDAAYARLIAGGIEPIPGAASLIRRLADRWPLAVCSGSKRNEIERILEQAGLLPFFPIIVAAEDVRESKPDPAGYLLALRRLRERSPVLTAGGCAVIEDSAAGIAAARAAGMRVVALRQDAQNTADADKVVDRLDALTVADLEALCA